MYKERFDYIDFAKGFAIFSIVLFHYCQPYTSGIWSKAIMIGGSGAHLFFVLSGFGLRLSATVDASTFYKKRFVKILLPYYLVVLTIYIINTIYPIYEDNGLYALFGHLLLYKMFDESIMTSFGYHFWFLSTIIQFYIAFPLIILLQQKVNTVSFIGITLLISILYWLTITYFNLTDLRIYNSFFLQYLWEFSAGMVLVKYYKDKNILFWEQKNIVLFSVAILGISTMAIMALKGGSIGKVFNDIPASIGYLSLSALLFSISKEYIHPIKNFFISVGKFSYELYLIHMLIFVLMNNSFEILTGNTSNIFIGLFVILPLSIILSTFIHRLFSSILRGTQQINNKNIRA